MVDSKSAPEAQSYSSIQAKRRLDDARRLLKTGSITESQELCRELLGEHPEYVAALCTLGQTYISSREFDAALPCFMRASMLFPDEPSILLPLANVYFHLKSGQLAINTAMTILSLNPDEDEERDTHLLLGRVYKDLNDYEQAVAHLSQAAELAGGSSDASLLLGACYLAVGETKLCEAAFSKALAGIITPLERAEAYYGLSSVIDSESSKILLKDIEALENEDVQFEDSEDKNHLSAYLSAARAAILEKSGQHENAWTALETANEQLKPGGSGPYIGAPETEPSTLERAAGWMFAGVPAGNFGVDLPLTLLIVGASRSGKSTLERLIGSLPESACGYDSDLVQEAARQTSNSGGFLTLSYPGQLPTSHHRQFTQNYVHGIKARARGARVLTNTHPDLIADLGRITETVPNLKIIFVGRNVEDNAHRIFAKIFPKGSSPYDSDVSSVYEQLDGSSQLVTAWEKSIPNLTMRVCYEDMIADPKAVLGLVAKFCGLPAPKGKLPELVDDRDCSQPYLEYLQSSRSTSSHDTTEGRWVLPNL